MTTSIATVSLDAAGKTLGRIASEAAKALMGKTLPSYTPHIRSDVKVHVTNADKIRITEKKRTQQTYVSYSGYPGGLRTETLAMLNSRRGRSEVVRRAIARMIPRNRLHTARMKNLTITA